MWPHPSQGSQGSTPFSSLIFPPPPLPPLRATGLSHLYAFTFTLPPAFPSSAPSKFNSAFQAQAHVIITSENPLTMKNPCRLIQKLQVLLSWFTYCSCDYIRKITAFCGSSQEVLYMECTQRGRKNQYHHLVLHKWKLRHRDVSWCQSRGCTRHPAAEPGSCPLCCLWGLQQEPSQPLAQCGAKWAPGSAGLLWKWWASWEPCWGDKCWEPAWGCKEDASNGPFCIAGSWGTPPLKPIISAVGPKCTEQVEWGAASLPQHKCDIPS